MRLSARFAVTALLGLIPGFTVFFADLASAQEILSVTPSGAVRAAQQVLVKYSHEMVPLGDPKAKAPVEVSCKTPGTTKVVSYPGTGRWVDSKVYSYDFNQPLPTGVRCQVVVKTTTTLAGAQLKHAGLYEFSTGGPTILRYSPQYGHVEPGQYFVFEFDAAMDKTSIESQVYFESSKSIASPIKARVIAGAEREQVLNTVLRSDWQWSKYRELLEKGGAIKANKEFDRFVILAGVTKFPEDSQIAIVWPKGVLSTSKVPTSEIFKQQFAVMEEFTAKFSCDRVNPDRPCNPILNMRLDFSSSIKRKVLQGAQLVGPKGQVWKPIELVNAPNSREKLDPESGVSYLTFKAPFPAQTEFKVVLPKSVQDEIGRGLVNQDKFPLAVKTDEFSPLVKFAAPFGILELHADPVLPVSVRNVEKNLAAATVGYPAKTININSKSTPKEIIEYYRIVNDKDWGYGDEPRRTRGASVFADLRSAKSFQVPRPGTDRDFELIGIPLKEPGLHIVEVQSPRLGEALLEGGTMYVASAALVTNLSVHFKRGRDSSLVWVTTLDKAQVVAGAEVSILDGDGHPVVQGKTDQQGMFRTSAKLPCAWDDQQGTYGERCELFVFAKSGNDFSFVSSNWNKGIEQYRFSLNSEYLRAPWGPLSAHAVLDRAVIQAGETLNFKVFLRDRTQDGFRHFPQNRAPKRLTITHNATGKVFELPIKFDAATGTIASQFAVPKTASFGFYEIKLSQRPLRQKATAADGDNEYDWDAQSVGNFVVEEYRLPLMESTVKIQGENAVQPGALKVDLSANYLSGGPARELPVKIRAALERDSFRPEFPGADEYTFFSKTIRLGTSARSQESNQEADLNFVSNQSLKLDGNGGASIMINGLPTVLAVRSLNVEMEYRDPNGEVKTGRGHVRLLPSDLIVGLKSESWLAKGGQAKVGGVVVRPNGQKVPGVKYTVEAYRTEYTSHRKRVVGGFYSYDSSEKTVSLGAICNGQTDAKGEFLCEAKKLPPGSVTLQARVLDSKGRPSLANVGVSVYEDSEMAWWDPSDSDRIDLVPEKNSYQAGEKAKFVLRTPFPESKVLVTVEREGVMDAFVLDLKRENPVFEVPIRGEFAPNVFVSAVAIRGRVGTPKPTALLDLARPAVKMGAAKILVGWKSHELKVSVTPEKPRYQARQKVKSKIKVVRADGQPLQAGEVTIAVVDEALSLLRKNWSVELLTGMMGERGWAVSTATSQVQVVGKRHYGSKARPPGGGGGESMESRELFEPVLKWIPSLKLNASGEADVEFELNDSITRFKIHAIATSGANHFGSGSATVVSSKDLILYSGFAPVVRDGDQIQNALTIRNTTSALMKIDLEVKSPDVSKLGKPAVFELPAHQSRTLFIPVTVPPGLKNLIYEIVAKDLTGSARDALKVKTRVDEAVPATVQQATLLQLAPSGKLTVQQPKDALAGRGGVAVDAKSSLVASLLGVRTYMEEYPYTCYEQLMSKAVSTGSKSDLKKLIQEMPSYMDGQGLLKYFPTSICGSPQLTRYILSVVKMAGEEIAPESLNRALDGLEAWLNGNYSCRSWWDEYASQTYRDQGKLLVIDVLSRWGRFKPDSLKPLLIQPNTWSTYAVATLAMVARREATFPNREQVMKEAETIVRARLNYQGTGLSLQNPVDWEAQWMLFASPDLEAHAVFEMILSAHAAGDTSWTDEAPRMARGVQARQKRGVWDSTMANAVGTLTLTRFASIFEKEKVMGQTQFVAPGSNAVVDWGKEPNGQSVLMKWPEGSSTKPVELKMEHKGSGKPWVLAQMRVALPLKSARDLGYVVSRKVAKVSDSGQLQTAGIKWKNGDVAEVTLTIVAKYDHPWVVVRDPVPAGATLLGGSLDGSSKIMARTSVGKPKSGEVANWPTEFEERSFSHFTSYAGYLMKGTYQTKYRVRLNSTGTFKLPPTRVEALYTPENFGESPVADWVVE